jgi:hypothetical protein
MARLLSTTDLTIAGAARSVRRVDANYASRFFHSHYGISPTLAVARRLNELSTERRVGCHGLCRPRADPRPDRFLSRARAVCITEGSRRLILGPSGLRALAMEQAV